MARNCEPEIREHVAMRMRKRAEGQKGQTGVKATTGSKQTNGRRATPPHYSNIQNVGFSLPK